MRNCCLFFFLLVLCFWLLIYRLRCVSSKKDQRSASGPAPELAGMSTRSRGARGNNWITVSSLLPWKRSRAGQSASSQQILKLLAMDRLVPETDMLNIDSTYPWPLMMSSFRFVFCYPLLGTALQPIVVRGNWRAYDGCSSRSSRLT